ncbi:fibronectin type III domain-containing protein [Oscillochloris sp. ZM17-4]|uniref:LamG-like jellyroll fold domain-containing protein n=1 Tax=Oscillochloris sp. ZM17-4 TaxID=2866714 RepID=UPI001C72B826|nr:LamG-like jellyroll fold domain-containing protein [Oscillochloris sp. ZM17-4]MBX0327346.1 fibronectin type III domain-containing protein [Oscillochloris sp. ZM17-4]
MQRYMPLIALLALLALPLGLSRPIPAQAQTVDGLVGYWPFERGSAEADRSGSGNTMTFADGMGLTSVVAPTRSASTTALLSVPAANSYATAPGTNIDGLQQFTIAFWLRANTLTQGPIDLVAINNKASVSFGRDLGSGDYFEFLTYASNTSRAIFFRGIQPGAYYHVAATYGPNGMAAYVNGQLLNSFDGSPALLQGAGVSVSSATAPLDGSIDDLRIYDHALSPSEIGALIFSCDGVSEIPGAECNALLDFFLQAAGPHWSNTTGWLQSNTPCSWHGVLCANGHVFGLYLGGNGLSGTISPALGSLPQLAVLDLSANKITGPIPFELGGLASLQTLDLHANQLDQTIPVTLGGLAKLQTLRLQNNRLRGAIPPQLAGLSQHLTTLDLSHNMLTASDPALLSFLSALQPAWAGTQTVPPTGLQARALSATSVALSWQPITYSGDGGYYDVLAMPTSGGAFSSAGHTADKSATSFTVTGLTLGQSYTFTLRSFTPKHGEQQSDLLSDASDLVSATPSDAPATITIVLDTQPDSRTNFRFGGSLGSFKLDDITPQDSDPFSSSKSFSVPGGTYTVTEQLSAAWSNANIFCSPPQGSIADLAQNQILINAAAGANISCTFVTQRNGEIVAGAYDDHNHNGQRDRGDAWLAGWQMQITSLRTLQTQTQTTNGEGRAFFRNLPPGDYQVCETLMAGWANVTPAGSGQPCYQVTVEPGQAVWARFGNIQGAVAAAAAVAEVIPVSLHTAAPAEDIIICPLPATDDAGNPLAAETDPWEAQEAAQGGFTVFLPIVVR